MREYSNPACQILLKYSDRLSQVAVPFELLYTEGVFTRETSEEIEMLGGYLINGPLRSLRNAVYKDHDVLKRFASILLKSEDTVSLAQDILNDYSRFNIKWLTVNFYTFKQHLHLQLLRQVMCGIVSYFKYKLLITLL